MLRRTYDWVMSLAASRHATPSLATVSFVESSFFPIPPDAMLIPMVLARPDRAWFYASVCTLASVLGGVFGYAIGFFFSDWVRDVVVWLNWGEQFRDFEALYEQWGLAVILLKGLTPFPYKIVTIASGLLHFSFPVFIIASVVTRGARFFMVAGLLKYFGPSILDFVEKRLTLVTSIVAVLIVAAAVAWHYLH
jgi:membrane protein YqaA with SNARE-associated domain